MITVSLCMIVKNEEAVLARCLDSIAHLMDEIIIVDTGSMDKTKEIAARYTNLVYDFTWTGSFSDARNFSFSKATKEYIYCADADEVLNEENQEKFRMLKMGLLPEIDIVQMYYANQLTYNTMFNYDKEYRPKLYKRVRHFIWENAIHEAVRLEPLIYESDIAIDHRPTSNHKSRDLAAFDRIYKDGVRLTKRLHNLYAKELTISGDPDDFIRAYDCFAASLDDESRDMDEIMEACYICAKASRLKNDALSFFKYTTKAIACGSCSEVCYELGEFYFNGGDVKEASIWFYNAAFETESILSIRHHTDLALSALSDCYKELGDSQLADEYAKAAKEAKDNQINLKA